MKLLAVHFQVHQELFWYLGFGLFLYQQHTLI